MFGKIFLILYVIIQTLMSILTEYVIEKNRFYKNIGKKTRVLRIIIYVLLAIIPVLGAYLPKSSFKFYCMGIGNIWLGFFMYYSGLVIFVTIITHIICMIKKDEEQKALGQAFNVAFVVALLVFGYGLFHAQNPKIVNYDIRVDKQTENVKNLKVVLIADLHLSVNSDVKATEKMVEEVNSVNPDVVVIAGDIFTSNFDGLRHPEKYSAALSKMQAKYGVYAVCGNHDVDENLFGGFSISPISEAFRTEPMEKFFDDAGFTVLYDENIELADGEIILSGRVDGEKAGDGTANRMSAKDLLAPVDKTKPVLVLQHEPIEFKDLAENGADVVFCGHTHNGQVFPGNLVVPFFNENAYGVKKLHGIDTIVTAGVGYYGPPIRVGTDSEVTVVNISFK
ncbi:MAG: metallophosphoesterase [Eubacterium sp.]|nr:metallophosphoesterase [Eubacterium sp.]